MDRRLRTDDADAVIHRGLTGHPGSGLHHTNDGNIQFFLDGFQRIGTGCIAGDHDGLDLLGLKETDDLPRIAGHRLLGFASVRNSGRIAKIYNLLVGKIPHDLADHGQSANAGIKHTDGCFTPVFHFLTS